MPQNAFAQAVRRSAGKELSATQISTIQVNLGLRCNLACRHCHVGGSPERGEVMTPQTLEAIARLAGHFPGCLIDLTGGAPEMNPHFRAFVIRMRRAGHPVQVRTNLTVLGEKGYAELPEFFKTEQLQLVASLPCYLDVNVTAQRGAGVFARSIEALRRLNDLGYGRDPELQLSLVYNPGGPSLPPSQDVLEAAYRKELRENYGVEFTSLYTITNMPIGRFLDDLRRQGKDEQYRDLLADAFNPETLPGLMCRHQICVSWDGTLYDCDFNFALDMPVGASLARHVAEVDPAALGRRRIVTGEHCFGCTAGCGSSCGGALVA